jgi:membrane fusion protein, heavy metal efflux system
MTTMSPENSLEQAKSPRGGGPRRWTRTLRLVSAVAASGLSIWLSTAFTREPPAPGADPPGMKVGEDKVSLAPGAPQWKVLKVGAASAASPHWADKVPARVQIDQARASQVSSPLAGRVTSVLVELGQDVRAGDPLFSVSSPEIASLRAERDKAALELATARRNLDRVQAMVAVHALPAKDEIAATQQVRQLEVETKLAESKMEALRISPSGDNSFTVKAPRSGVVVEKNVLAAQEVSPDTAAPLLAIADLSTVWVTADLFEANASDVKEGAQATVTLPALPGAELAGRVEMVSSVVDPARHSVPIRLQLENPRRLLKPNMYAEVKLSVGAEQDSVEVPASALVTDGAHEYVYVQATPGEFSRREVIAGSARDGSVPILGGLHRGEVVVQEGAILLENQIALGS